jgi:hypothetical protein
MMWNSFKLGAKLVISIIGFGLGIVCFALFLILVQIAEVISQRKAEKSKGTEHK